MNVWEVEESGPVEEEPPKRKRRTQNHDPISEREPAGDDKPWKAGADQLVGISGNVDFHFYFYVGESGTILTVGSLYCFDFCRDSVFICTSISKNKELFKFTFLLCSLVEGKVESVDGSVCCTLNDMKHVLSCSYNVGIGSKAKGLVDKIICEGWDRVLCCQVNNCENVSYLLDLRKSCLASQIRQGVYSGISRNATRPAQPIHLGVFDPMYDSRILGLTSENQFQVSYSGKDLAKLDSLLGAKWDIKILEPGNPCSHFKYVCKVRFFVHRPSMTLRLNFVYSESNIPFTVDYRSICTY